MRSLFTAFSHCSAVSIIGLSAARTRRFALVCGVLLIAAAPMLAQAPGWSRGQQTLSISYDDCVRRMPAALQAEGYRVDHTSGDFAVGIKQVHTAVIICSPAPEQKMLVHIVVASNGEGGGRERQCLQAQMDQVGASRCGGSAAGTGDVHWVYRDGGFTDNQVFHPDGTAGSEGNREARATWKIEGNEMVVRWWNGWTNRYGWNNSGQLSGTAFGPNGERHSITLTRK